MKVISNDDVISYNIFVIEVKSTFTFEMHHFINMSMYVFNHSLENEKWSTETRLWNRKKQEAEQLWQSLMLPDGITVSSTAASLLHKYFPESETATLEMCSDLSTAELYRLWGSLNLCSLSPSTINMSTVFPLISLLHVSLPSTEWEQRRESCCSFSTIWWIISAKETQFTRTKHPFSECQHF